jgi:hypothetical protein
MTFQHFKSMLSQNRWWIALVILVAMGYSVGKDMALRDNARDQIKREAN